MLQTLETQEEGAAGETAEPVPDALPESLASAETVDTELGLATPESADTDPCQADEPLPPASALALDSPNTLPGTLPGALPDTAPALHSPASLLDLAPPLLGGADGPAAESPEQESLLDAPPTDEASAETAPENLSKQACEPQGQEQQPVEDVLDELDAAWAEMMQPAPPAEPEPAPPTPDAETPIELPVAEAAPEAQLGSLVGIPEEDRSQDHSPTRLRTPSPVPLEAPVEAPVEVPLGTHPEPPPDPETTPPLPATPPDPPPPDTETGAEPDAAAGALLDVWSTPPPVPPLEEETPPTPQTVLVADLLGTDHSDEPTWVEPPSLPQAVSVPELVAAFEAVADPAPQPLFTAVEPVLEAAFTSEGSTSASDSDEAEIGEDWSRGLASASVAAAPLAAPLAAVPLAPLATSPPGPLRSSPPSPHRCPSPEPVRPRRRGGPPTAVMMQRLYSPNV